MSGTESSPEPPQSTVTADYCSELQRWMWQYYWGYSGWQSWLCLSASSFPPLHTLTPPGVAEKQAVYARSIYPYYPPGLAANSTHPVGGGVPTDWRSVQTVVQHQQHHQQQQQQQQQPQQNGNNAPQTGREYTVPSPLQRFLAETVDFMILFCVKATIVLWVVHLSGMKDIAKLISHFIVEEIDETTSLEDLQKMMVMALVYRLLVCVYETICIWGAGGATPGKFLLGLRVVTCNTSAVVQPNRVLVAPASNVSFSASMVRALNKNFSIAFLFPVFITLLFFQHNRTVYDVVAGTIVVQRSDDR